MSKNSPSASIVVPARNEEKLLAQCLKSLLEQDYVGDYEIIVVDNASTDRTAEIASGFGVKVVYEANVGTGPARQCGLLEARGEIIAFTDADYDELLQYLLEDADLAVHKVKRPSFQVLNTETDDNESPTGFVRLEKIFNMNNINALVSGQTLVFCPTLTAVFGANDSGKSGYARVLGCAVFTRGDKQVFPDLTKPYMDGMVLSADIEIFDGSANRVINYRIGTKCSELAQCYVFDSTSVHVHLMGSNAFSFSPAGLSYLTQLSEVTDSVRHRLNVRIEEYNQPHNFAVLFPGESPIKETIEKLGPDTDLEELSHLATLTAEDRKRMKELDIEIAKLKSRNIPKEIEIISETVKDLSDLKQGILSAELAQGQQ